MEKDTAYNFAVAKIHLYNYLYNPISVYNKDIKIV